MRKPRAAHAPRRLATTPQLPLLLPLRRHACTTPLWRTARRSSAPQDLAAFVDADGAVSLFHCLLPGAFVAKAAAVLEASATVARDAVVVDTLLDRHRFECSVPQSCPRDDANASLYCAVTVLEAAGDKSSSVLVWRGQAGTAWLVAATVVTAACLLSGWYLRRGCAWRKLLTMISSTPLVT